MVRAHGFRTGVEAAVVLAIVGLCAKTWLLELRVVTTGSMAETVLGRHRMITCADCGYTFACGSDIAMMYGEPAVCPNCDDDRQLIDDFPELRGEEVAIFKAAFEARPPRRWELAAFRLPDDPRRTLMKRIVGLPDERIEIRDGDVFADGHIVRKSLPEQRALAVPVHDDRFRPTTESYFDIRWQDDPTTGGWLREAGGWRHLGYSNPKGALPTHRPLDWKRKTSDEASNIDWLTYHHLRRVRGDPAATKEGPITDEYGYNQSLPVIHRNVVCDLMMVCRLRYDGSGSLAFYAADGRETFVATVDVEEGSAELRRDSAVVATAPFPPAADAGSTDSNQSFEVVLSLFDRRFLMAIDGRVLFDQDCAESEPPPEGTSRPFAIGSGNGLQIGVDALRILRDVYYTHVRGDDGREGDRSVQLSKSEYFVLGDNSPLSEDSRRWGAGRAVTRGDLVGRPVFAFPAPERVKLGPVWIQVPRLGKFRYIR